MIDINKLANSAVVLSLFLFLFIVLCITYSETQPCVSLFFFKAWIATFVVSTLNIIAFIWVSIAKEHNQ